MANLKSYIDAPLFFDDTELSASLLNIIRNNSEAIKNSVLIPQPIFDINRVLQTQNNHLIWRGGFQYRTGLTTATFVIYSKQVSGQGEHDIVITFDGVEVDRYDARIGGTGVGGFSGRNLAINSRGYTDFQIITVQVHVIPVAGGGDDDATKGVQYVHDAYVHPLSNISIGSWPGLPTFGTIDATKLNQVANASDYLANRLSVVPMPLSMGYVQWMGTNNPKYPNFRYFMARATNGNSRIKTNVWYQCRQTQAYIRMNVGGVVFTKGPYTLGQNVLIQFDEDLIAAGLSWNVDYFSYLQELTTIEAPSDLDNNGGRTASRIDNGPIYMGANSYSVTTVRPENLMRESLTYGTVQTRLNNIKDDLATSYATINANPRVFDRATMARSRYGINAEQNEYWATTFVPSIYRQGDLLWVKGQGLKIAYGSVTIKHKTDEKPNGIREYEFQFEEELLDGDKITQSYFYLDQFEGLYPGMRYYIIGKDIIYAAEHLR
jgi:hypothetical protein